MAVVGIKTKRELIAVASAYYAEANVSAKLFLEADALLAESTERSLAFFRQATLVEVARPRGQVMTHTASRSRVSSIPST